MYVNPLCYFFLGTCHIHSLGKAARIVVPYTYSLMSSMYKERSYKRASILSERKSFEITTNRNSRVECLIRLLPSNFLRTYKRHFICKIILDSKHRFEPWLVCNVVIDRIY